MPIPAVEGAIVLTSSSRLARWLLYQVAEQKSHAALKCWPTPAVFTLSGWLETLWRQSWPQQHVLSNLQSVKLWEKTIRSDPRTPRLNLLHLQGAAVRAAQAYGFIRQYHLPLKAHEFQWTHESEAFHIWIKEYQSHLKKWQALDPAALPDALRDGMRTGSIPLPRARHLILAGFDEITPQIRSLLDYLQANGVTIEHESNATQPPGKREVREYKDRREEAVQCARWIGTGNDTVGVVDLNQYGNLLQRELATELVPLSAFPWVEQDLPFNMTIAAPLPRQPMIHLALSILSVPREPVPFATFSALLGTPFLHGGESETAARGRLDMKLRQKNTGAVYLSEVDALSDPQNDTPQLKTILPIWKEMIAHKERQTASAWAHAFSGFLRRIGWPAGESTLKTHQAFTSWTECLDTFASLDRITGELTRTAAAALLSQIAEEKPFQVKTAEQPIQVIDLRQSTGMKFDRLWVMGCNADVLPAAPSPNPFLPLPLQKNLPHSSSDWELQFAERALSRLAGCAPHIVFSFAAWEEDTELKMSPLLKGITKKNPAPEIIASRRLLDQPQAQLEILQDDPVLTLTNRERDTLNENVARHGYSVLRNQAQCPFRAFAKHRLHTQKLTVPETEIDAEESRERGTLVHNALENFWSRVKKRSRLQRLHDDNRLTAAIHDCIQETIGKTLGQVVLNTQPQFVRLESERVGSLLQNWLERELLRPDFEVLFKEKLESVTIGGLQLYIRIDRMDRTKDNQLILIDYKTGHCSIKDWLQERVQEPQLPLYALKFSPHAIAYAVVQKDDKNFGWKTITGDPAVIKELGKGKDSANVNWREQMQWWEDHLTALANEFLNGNLIIDPFDRNKTCRNCGLNTLCRIEESKSLVFDPGEINE